MQNMSKYILITISIIILVSCAPKQSEIVVAEYGNNEILMNEFENAYVKNVGSPTKAKSDSLDDYKKFLDLYVNFKMKLRDAEVRRLDKDPSIINELNSYQRTIGASYLLEKELYEKGMKDLYDKRSEELRVSHLLIRADTISDEKAKQKALEIIDRIKNGGSFEKEVKLHSDDQFSRNKGGDIYYITAGTVLPEFEDLAYNTPVGEVNSTPLKTKYGYHIIKVTERQKRVPKIRASHILIRSVDDKGRADDSERTKLVKEILDRAKSGEDFGKLAAEYSEDPGSKMKNGDLGFFGRRQMVQPFDEAAFKLDVGEISGIVETQFGFHIIKVTAKEEYPSFDKEKKVLRELYERSRKQKDYDNLVANYSKELNLKMHDDVIKEVISNAENQVINDTYWESELKSNFGGAILFTIKGQKFTLDSLMAFSLKDPKQMGKTIESKGFTKLLNDYKNEKLIEVKALDLVKNDPKFAALMDEYKNGILIFRLQENEVWNKMKMDSVAIRNLYEQTKQSYIWPDRVQYLELFTKSDSLAKEFKVMLENGADFDSLIAKYSPRKQSNTLKGLIDANTNALTKAAFALKNGGDYSDIIRNVNGWSIVKLVKKELSRPKTFDEARAEVTSAYQDIESAQLENAYIARLKKVYEPELFYEELANAFKN